MAGPDYVCQIITFGKLKAKAVIRMWEELWAYPFPKWTKWPK